MTHFILDCDDVLLDWQSSFIAYLSARDVLVDPAGPSEWDIAAWIGCSPDAARSWVARHNASSAFGRLNARPGATRFLDGLLHAGHSASVLTSCGSNRATAQARVKNLDLAFGRDAFTEIDVLPLGQSKFEHLQRMARGGGDLVFVDDNFTHAQSGAVCGIRSYCLRRSHNRADEAANPGTSVMWLDDLHQLLGVIA